MSYIPYVIEQNSRGERSYDIYSRLLKDSKRSDCKQYCGTDVILRVRRSGEGY